jgi:hypothetical protein
MHNVNFVHTESARPVVKCRFRSWRVVDVGCEPWNASPVSRTFSIKGSTKGIITKNPFNDGGDAFDVDKAHFGLTGKLDQIAPDSFRTGKTLPYPCFGIGQQMNRHITPLHFVASAAQRADEMGG